MAQTMPLFAPIPQDRQLARLCKAFLKSPGIQATPLTWAQRLHKGLRTFTRFFHQQTGMSFGAWRQQACLLAALPRLSAGAVRHVGRARSRLRQPQRVFHHVQETDWQDTNGLYSGRSWRCASQRQTKPRFLCDNLGHKVHHGTHGRRVP